MNNNVFFGTLPSFFNSLVYFLDDIFEFFTGHWLFATLMFVPIIAVILKRILQIIIGG